MQLAEILRIAHDQNASDVHLIAGHPPMMRVNTVMTPLEHPVLEPEVVEKALREILNENQWNRLQEQQDLDFSHEIDTPVGRPMKLSQGKVIKDLLS